MCIQVRLVGIFLVFRESSQFCNITHAPTRLHVANCFWKENFMKSHICRRHDQSMRCWVMHGIPSEIPDAVAWILHKLIKIEFASFRKLEIEWKLREASQKRKVKKEVCSWFQKEEENSRPYIRTVIRGTESYIFYFCHTNLIRCSVYCIDLTFSRNRHLQRSAIPPLVEEYFKFTPDEKRRAENATNIVYSKVNINEDKSLRRNEPVVILLTSRMHENDVLLTRGMFGLKYGLIYVKSEAKLSKTSSGSLNCCIITLEVV